MNPETASVLIGTWGYSLYLLLFLLTALGSPLTEDLLLLIGGYLIGMQVFSWAPTATTACVGILGADLCLFWFGRKLRAHTLRRGFVRHVIRPGRLRLAARWFTRFGDGVIFLSRLVPGTRVLVFVSAGLRGVPVARFLVLDGLAAALWVPALLWLGRWAGERIGSLGHTLEIVGDRVFVILLVIVVAYALRHWWLKRERAYGTADTEP